ncbi:ArnT family glycosyltransferase [Nitratidesulfovibrio sp. SRB-5]|uniref:ArnT family glycosyltransferase n=1 Tax=Nitratidesulfovibrio sp. SRB-5 TaxID=2872636 RepID=UPI0010273170|nr:glycosyltransferase family 39 protein [Nitratidesulfovibrio sp. SRB-5]MBZ2170806.1 glycosyltransferase family 39 protein [Nitratidesulfovibrio sp. SRB-5]RXF76567.1 glycosyltransferase family 39 protein [Desulfovibrio sp. DS-1]
MSASIHRPEFRPSANAADTGSHGSHGARSGAAPAPLGLPAAPIWERNPALCAGAIIAVTTLVRLWFVISGQLDLVQDESQYWDWSRRLQLSYYSKGPLIAWLIHGWTALLGDTETGVRMGAVVNAALAQTLLYLGVARLFRAPALGVLTLFVANTTPLFIASGVLMTTDSPLLLCWAGALFCLHWISREPRGRTPYVLLFACMALGVLAKYMMLAMAGVAVLWLWGLARHDLLARGVAWRVLAVMLAGSAVGMLPILAWNISNDWVSFRHVATLAGVAGKAAKTFLTPDRLPEHLGAQAGIITPWWLGLMLVGGWRALRNACSGHAPGGRNGAGGGGMASVPGTPSVPTAPIGAGCDPDRLRRDILLAAGFWPLWGGMTLWSLHTRIYPNWPAMSYVAGIMLAACCLADLVAARRRDAVLLAAGTHTTVWRRLVPVWAVLGVLTFGLVHAQDALPLPPQYNPATRLKGWADLGEHLDEVRRQLPDPDRVFFFSDAYDMTASLAFYAPGQPVTYCADFGRRMSQYDIWPAPTDKVGWDAVLVRRDGPRMPPQLEEMFESVQVTNYQSTHRGKPGRTFWVVVLRGFNGHWPNSGSGAY